MLRASRRSFLLGFALLACTVAGAEGLRQSSADSVEHAPKAASPQASSAAPLASPLDLSNFRPLLLRPEYAPAAELVDDGQAQAAAAWILAQQSPEPEAWYLVGRLAEEANNPELAKTAYARAASLGGSLREDAELHLAELELAAQRWPEAEAAWARAPHLHEELRARRVETWVDFHRGRLEGALSAAMAWAEQEKPLELVTVAADIVKSLLDQGKAGLKERDWARHLLSDASLKLPPRSSERKLLLEKSAALGAQLNSPAQPLQSLQVLQALASVLSDEELSQLVEDAKLLQARPASSEACELEDLLAKLEQRLKKPAPALARLEAAAKYCDQEGEAHARLLFNWGKALEQAGRDAQALAPYLALVEQHRGSSLADDALLRAARAYKDMGAPARYIELLQRLPEEFPDGDMSSEGALELALYRMERQDYSGALAVLERRASWARERDRERGLEFAGTERYFFAKAKEKMGLQAEALDIYDSIVRELPLSYYMLLAYSRLHALAPERAAQALSVGTEAAEKTPFELRFSPAFQTPEFQRALSLFLVGDQAEGRRVLLQTGLSDSQENSVLWGLAMVLEQAGDATMALKLSTKKGGQWLSHYPRGSWSKVWELGFPRPHYELVQKESEKTGVPEWLIYAIMREESRFDPKAESPAQAYGLMQLILPSARHVARGTNLTATRQSLFQPKVNIALGSRMLADLEKRFPAQPWLSIPAYNAGPGRPERWRKEHPEIDFDVWVELIPFRETRRYTKRVLASRAAYAFLYHPEQLPQVLLLPERLEAAP